MPDFLDENPHEILAEFASAVDSAIGSMDNDSYYDAFNSAVEKGLSESQINELLTMDEYEQEEVYGDVLLPADTQIAIQDLINGPKMNQGWN
jgi:hypothetical protein